MYEHHDKEGDPTDSLMTHGAHKDRIGTLVPPCKRIDHDLAITGKVPDHTEDNAKLKEHGTSDVTCTKC